MRDDKSVGPVLMVVLLAGACLTCLIGSVAWWIVGFVWNTGTGVANRVANPDAVVGGYEWYEQQLKDIKAVEGQIKDADDSAKAFKADNGEAAGWRFDQREEYGRLNSNLTGLKQARRKMIEDYNAKAAMITRNLWKSPTCPQHIEE